MMRFLSSRFLVLALAAALLAGEPAFAQKAQPQLRPPDTEYIPTPPDIVNIMLRVAAVGKSDIVYDLGSGDGRIPIAAVRDFGAARAVGIDIDPERIREANDNLKLAGVGDRVQFLNQDLFTTDISEATVVMLYLLPNLNLKLLPKLKAELRPGTRIVSHMSDMGNAWKPEKILTVFNRKVFLWTIPK